MRRFRSAAVCVLLIVVSLAHGQTAAEFHQRRQRFVEKMAKNSAAIFLNAPGSRELREYRSDSNFYYLTGWTEPQAVLLLFKRRIFLPELQRFSREVLLVPKPRTGRAAVFMGQQPTLEEIEKKMNFDAVAPIGDYENLLPYIFTRFDSVYLQIPRTRLNEPLSRELELIRRARDRLLKFEIVNPMPILTEMRSIKSETEISLLRKAIEITCQAHREVMRSAEPGMYEYELEAILEYVFHRNGAFFVGFPSIVGSGPNALILHYDRNTRKTKPGELVVVDIGAEYRMYSADVTRTIPISGHFTPAQAEVYQVVLEAQKAAIAVIQPGASFMDVNNAVQKVLQARGFAKFLPHGVSHPIGLDVHDIGGGKGTLQPGMIITVEPGIYIPAGSTGVDSSYWNIGIRIEDDVLVTETGHEVLSGSAPKTIQEIESLMKKRGVGNVPLQ